MKLDTDRGSFFHEVYRIEQKLGKVFRELEPHALYPVDEYFNGKGRYEKPPLAVITPYAIEEDSEQDAKAKAKLKSLLKFPIKKVA
jgi:hypothetical protein